MYQGPCRTEGTSCRGPVWPPSPLPLERGVLRPKETLRCSMPQVLLLELEPLRCWPTFRSKEHAVPDSVLRRPTGLKLLVARACANHASAAAAGVEWERRRTVLSLEVAWSTEYMRGSASICCYAVDASSEWSVPAAEVFSSCNCRSTKV